MRRIFWGGPPVQQLETLLYQRLARSFQMLPCCLGWVKCRMRKTRIPIPLSVSLCYILLFRVILASKIAFYFLEVVNEKFVISEREKKKLSHQPGLEMHVIFCNCEIETLEFVRTRASGPPPLGEST